jgi:uncharacterized protein (TIGR02996 family)
MSDKRSDMRKAFLDAIKADPYDLKTRKIFADWLDEFGDDRDGDLAVEQRTWTKEKQDAIVWLADYARHLDMSYEELLQVANDYVNHGEGHCLPFDTPDCVYTENDEFWQRLELATGKKVADKKKHPFFSCAC